MGWDWQRRVDGQWLDFTGPTGKLLFRLHDDVQGARAQNADGKQYAAGDVEALLLELTGWRLPVAGLQYWARGLPIPGMPYDARFDARARLLQLTQAGWSLVYREYASVGALELPRKFELETLARDERAIRVKVVIREWRLADVAALPLSPS